MRYPQLNALNAVNNKMLVTFKYHDKIRLVEPHAMSLTKFSAYQIFPEPGWRLFNLDEMEVATFAEPRVGFVSGGGSHITDQLMAAVA